MNIRNAVEVSVGIIISLFIANAVVASLCYNVSATGIMIAWAVFVLPGMLLPLTGLWFGKPAAAVGSLLFFAACFCWVAVDGCASSYAGGGAFTAYFVLIFAGLPIGLLGFAVGWWFEKFIVDKSPE